MKTTIRYHLTPARMAITKKTRYVLVRMLRNRMPCTLMVGMQTGAATVENSMAGPQKAKHRNTM